MEAVRINPDFAKAHLGLGLAYLSKNDKHSALEEYKVLKELSPQLAEELFKRIYP